MAKKQKGTQKSIQKNRDSAIIIDSANEEFCLVSSQTVLSSQDKMEIKHNLDDSEMGSLRRAGFNLSFGNIVEIERRNHFDGMILSARESGKEFNYKFANSEQYDLSGLSFPAPSVANFSGGYSSRDGCFIVCCSNKTRRVLFIAGTLDRGNSRLKVFGFPTTVAKALHSVCTAFPELIPETYIQVHDGDGEDATIEEYPIYGQSNTSVTSYLNIAVQPEIFEDQDIRPTDAVVVRVELPKIPNGTCIMQCVAKTE